MSKYIAILDISKYRDIPQVNTDGDKQHLQKDLDKLVKSSEKWQMLLNFGKCKCLHTGHRNLDINHNIGGTVLGTTVKEKDLGITISSDTKVSEQCDIAASNGNQILGLIRRNTTLQGKKLIIPLYKAIVRPHLEYCIQARRPFHKKDTDTLEHIQRKAFKIIPELRDLNYEERLKECGLTRHGVNSIPELELTLSSNSRIGIDFRKSVGIGIFFFIGIDVFGIIDLILLIFIPLKFTIKIIFFCY